MNDKRPQDSGMAPVKSGSFNIIETRVPEPGVDYPRDEQELEAMLGSEAQCRAHLERLRFPRGFVCPRCRSAQEPWRSGSGLIACTACRRPEVLTRGTLFEGSTLPLRRWMAALWITCAGESGTSLESFHRALRPPSLETSAATLRHVRELMAFPARRRLSRDVHLTTSRVELSPDALGPHGHPIVAMAMDLKRGHECKIRLRHLPRPSMRSIGRFVTDHVEHGSRVITTPWRGYAALERIGYDHQVSAAPPRPKGGPSPGQIWSTLSLWLWSTPGVQMDQLQAHLDELTFRFNRRHYPRGLLFHRLMILAVLYGGKRRQMTLDTGT